MRIITGSARGCRLKAPKGTATRPTADRVKESLFNILGAAVRDALVLDMFAGAGNLGLEALSRGAAQAVFVDQSADSVRIIGENAAHTKLRERAEIIQSDAFSALSRLPRSGRKFAMVFCDPPYGKGLAQKALSVLDTLPILTDGARIVVEHDVRDELSLPLAHIQLLRQQRYGSTMISFFVFLEKTLEREDAGGDVL